MNLNFKVKIFQRKQKGFIAFISVLVVGALILVIGIAGIIISNRELNINEADKNNRQALALVNSCAELGILKLKENNQYLGGERIKIGNYFCNISLVSSIPGGKTFDATAKVGKAEKRAQVKIMDDSSFSINYY